MTRARIAAVATVLGLAAGACSSGTGMLHPPRTLTYCSPGGHALAMDLYLPVSTPGPRPVALFVHGGGWVGGNRRTGGFLRELAPGLTAKGIAVAAIDYRLAPAATFPAQIEDVTCAVRFLRASASSLQLDPGRVGAWGDSAGGQLVALLGTADRSAGFDTGQYLDRSSRVQAVADLFGPSDLVALSATDAAALLFTKNVFGVTPSSANAAETLRAYSPVTYVSTDDPPFLILHGDADTTVPLGQSQELAERLQAVGVPARLVVVNGGPHGLGLTKESPGPGELVRQIIDFFATHLSP